jgi:hypothetical protein
MNKNYLSQCRREFLPKQQLTIHGSHRQVLCTKNYRNCYAAMFVLIYATMDKYDCAGPVYNLSMGPVWVIIYGVECHCMKTIGKFNVHTLLFSSYYFISYIAFK